MPNMHYDDFSRCMVRTHRNKRIKYLFSARVLRDDGMPQTISFWHRRTLLDEIADRPAIAKVLRIDRLPANRETVRNHYAV